MFSITGSKMDMYGNILSGTITLQPFTSKIIMDDDTPVPGETKYGITASGKYTINSEGKLLVTTT